VSDDVLSIHADLFLDHIEPDDLPTFLERRGIRDDDTPVELGRVDVEHPDSQIQVTRILSNVSVTIPPNRLEGSE
jgi:hypothetical protein